jgi:hypothetical protein
MRSSLAFFAAIIAGVCLSACDGLIVVIGTGPSPLAGSTATAVVHINGGTIPFGTPVNGSLTTRGSDVQYHVVAPRTGTLVLGVNWDRSHGPLDVLFASNMLPRPIGAAPFSARLAVQAGQTYVVRIADGDASGQGAISLPFTVTAAME